MSQSLYSVVDKDTLHNIVEAFYGCIKLPIQVIDEDGNFLESFGDTGKFCSFFQNIFLPKTPARKCMWVRAKGNSWESPIFSPAMPI